MDESSTSGYDVPLASSSNWNYANSTGPVTLEDLKMDSNMLFLLTSLLSSIAWIIYITFYHARIIGYIVTKLVNWRIVKGAYFKIGSLSMNPLAGKIMFRDVVYVSFDYTMRVQDGYMIFRWWRSYVPKDVSEDLSHSDTRLSVMLNGPELHVYNRSDIYSKMEKTFGLKPSVLIPDEDLEKLVPVDTQQQSRLNKQRSEAMAATTWRDLIPVIKVDITSGRFVFGNSIIPNTLSICLEEAHCVYSTKPAVSPLDHFMHFVKVKAENTKVILAPSPKYTGLVDEPPRFMGEGFVVMMSNLLELYFYMDEPGLVPEEPVLLTLANGDVEEAAAPPVWGIDIKCGKGTDFSYGPWADRQRDHLFRFFFPSDYQPMEPTAVPKAGDIREYQTFDVSLSTLDKATIDILFSKNKETSAVHIITGPGSYLEVTLPWTTQIDGFTTKVTGQLLHVEATTSLQFRSLLECESLQYNVKVHYPIKWNDHQDWSINLNGSKATAYIVYSHIDFFKDLVEDWASKQRPDILSFVPYTCKFTILLKEFELITTSNEYNWIDCSSTNQENHHIAFCGDLFDLSFSLPFDDFLPATIPLKFWIHGEGLDLSMYIPEISTSRAIFLGIDQNARILTRDGHIKKREELLTNKWRRVCVRPGWIDCWTVPIVALAIQYIYHPMPLLGPDPQADITTPEKEEILLSPMRIPKMKKTQSLNWNKRKPNQKFDPTTLPPDKVTVDVEIGSSILLAYGNILRNFIHLKENIFGEDQSFTDMETSNNKPNTATSSPTSNPKNKDDHAKSISEVSAGAEEAPKRFDPRLYRPFEVIVSVTIHDIQAHVMKNCNENDPPCPIVLIERLGFEMVKTYTETQLQVLVSPCFLISHDMIIRSNKDRHLRQGHLLLSALQVRGHAMFSNEGRSLDEETLEYAWLLEVQLGKLSGKLTVPQLYHVVTGLETLVLLAVDAENELRPPKTLRYCHHGMPTHLCPQTKDDARYRCPSSEDIKYRMTRISIDAVDLYLVENGTALHTWISPIRLSNCNLHGQQVKSGITLMISTILLRNFISTGGHFNHPNGNSHSNTNTTGSGRSVKGHPAHHSSTKNINEKNKDDLNYLFQKDEHVVKSKRESDYVMPKKEGKEKEEVHPLRKPCRESESFYFRRGDKDDIYASIYSTNRNKELEYSEPWLEVGSMSLGPVIVEAASALPIPEHCLHLVQHNFLKIHDDKSKRLWFLWLTTMENSRCGCVGGCSFFGSNRNGLKFFKPSAQDLHEGINIARYHILPNSKEYGFGQSLLHEGQLVFHTPPYSIQNVTLQECYEYLSKGSMNRSSRHSIDTKSPVINKYDSMFKNEISPSNTLRTPSLERPDKKSKERDSPHSMDRRGGRRSSYTSSRQNVQDVPYARLLDTPSKGRAARESTSTIDGSTSSPYNSYKQDPLIKGLKISPPKTSASDSRLTVDYFQDEVGDHLVEMSSSAPPTNPLEQDLEASISSCHNTDDDAMDRDLQVQRTVSLTSENPSEAFFSADEDIQMSQSSSIRKADLSMPNTKKRFASDLSIGGQGDLETRLSSHRSDYEINTPEHRSLPKRPQSTAELHGTDSKRIHGLITPIRKFSNVSPKPEFRHFKATCDPVDSQDSSSNSPSLSSTSFISALSSQEDITLVNLHMQVNRPIVDSPLLMASYVTHLGQLKCYNWNHCSLPFGSDAFSTPLFQQNEDGGLIYIGSKLVPHFEPCSNWREVKVMNRNEVAFGSASTSANIPSVSTAPKSHPWDPSVMIKSTTSGKDKDEKDENEFLLSTSESITRHSIVVRFKGPADLMVTPLLLEGLQRMIESITPTLSTLHPLTIINYLHQECVSKVQSDNVLKRDQSLSYWSQVHSNSKRSTTERNLQGPGGSVLTDVYEESISTQLQGLIVLPKFNVTMIQSSVVEEVISFAALDNVHDLSCASLLVVSFDSTVAKFHLAKTTKAAMHTVYTQPTIQSGNMKKGGIFRGTTRALWANISSQTRPDNIPGEPVLIETSEKQLEELVVTLDIGKAHAQLRRLKNEGCAFQENQIIITSIPSHRCKAMFDVAKYPDDNPDKSQGFGYIMFECGLEGVGVKIVKRSHFEKSENSQNDENDPTTQVDITATAPSTKKSPDPTSSATPDLSDKVSHSELKGVISKLDSKIGIKLPITPKISLSKDKNPMDLKFKENLSKEGPSKATKTTKDGATIINIEEGPKDAKEGTSQDEQAKKTAVAVPQNNDNGKTSSGFIQLKTVWFNFAAPPHVPITRKIDYSRLDWNLLSTASPAITAWMNPSNRFAIKIVAMLKAMHHRRTAVTSCLMADALEVQGIHRRIKSRYSGKLTPLSKTLQEDPSCQLCTILQKYVQKETVKKVESILRSQSELPPLTTLRQGVIVLSRQWKNTLYNPMLFEHQYKNKLVQPINVTYSMPQYDEDYDDNDLDTEMYPVSAIDSHPLMMGDEETERTTLLGQSTTQHRSVIKLSEDSSAGPMGQYKFSESIGTSSPSMKSSQNKGGTMNKKKGMKMLMAQSSGTSNSARHTTMFPIISGFGDKEEQPIEYGALIDGSVPSIYSSSDSIEKPVSPVHNPKEDLYSWMAKQQSVNMNRDSKRYSTKGVINKPATTKQTANVLSSVNTFINDSNTLLDAHLIFEPLLSSLGVMPQQMVNNANSAEASLESLGTNLSLVGSFDTMRIDIVVSEACEKKTKGQKPIKKPNGKVSIKLPMETPAFLCERVGVDIEVLKVADGLIDGNKPNMLYISRGQLKKHTNTVVNVSLNVRYILQQVNMPLLRLLHQISNMYQNVKQAQIEMKDQPETGKRSAPAKDESSLASEMNEPTLVGSSIHEPISQMDIGERYDKFNEFFPIGHSVSRTKMPSLGPLIPLTPSPSSRNRPQSFAQKLRSTSKTVKGKLGYTNLSETVSTPIKSSPTISSSFDLPPIQAVRKNTMESKHSVDFVSGPLVNEAFVDFPTRSSIDDHDRLMLSNFNHNTPKCWKTIYHLLDLYAQKPETKTICRRVSTSPDAADHLKSSKKSTTASQKDDDEHLITADTPIPPALDTLPKERTRFMIFGVAKIHRTRLLAMLSGLKLEAEITALQSSATWRKKSRPVSLECSLTGHVGRAMIVLLEGIAPNQQTVVRVTVGKSQTLYSSMTRRGKDKNSGLLSVGPINIDIPQHPVALHGMMTRSSKQISSTLQELRVTRTSSRLSKQNEELDSPHLSKEAKEHIQQQQAKEAFSQKASLTRSNNLLQPLVMQFNVVLQSLSVTAALLPSLQAQYKMDNVTSTGFTGSKAKFVIDLPSHSLSFTTKVQPNETNLPSEAFIALPPVHVSAEYVPESAPQDVPIDGVVLRQGGYVAASAEIGEFERCLTTDLLNHLVFVQKVFMKEVNEVVQKVYGGEKPVPLWLEENEGEGNGSIKRILFSLNIKVQRIQLTATTPCSSAVRFETGLLELHLSNRVKNIADRSNTKLFAKAQIDLNISLGQLIKNVIFDEAEPEFQQYAFFNTTIGFRNAFQDELVNEDKELVLITLKRPLIYIQPVAVDKAILVWLNYKNAYEYWAEKRANLNKEVLAATQQVYEKLPFGQFSQHLGSQGLSTLFLQLTVEDMGICLPLNPLPLNTWGQRTQEFDTKGAVVITLENTIISACNSGSLVSTGRFVGLCWRFADDFETSLDDWKPNMNDTSIMNLCVVSEGTYEVCSRTIAAKHSENAKWFLNVKWQMEGVDIHLDVNIGKQLSALGHTLTMLTGSDEEDTNTMESPDSDEGEQFDGETGEPMSKAKRKLLESVPEFVFDPTIDSKKRSIMMEKEMSEQLKIISDLRTLGATQNTIAHEERRLQELQAICYKYFRKDMIQKWKRPSIRRSMLKSTNRSRSFIISSPTRESIESEHLDAVLQEDEINSQGSSPTLGPSRSASLRVKIPQSHRVTFNESMRQSSLPSAESDGNFPDGHGLEWPAYSDADMNILDIDGESVELRKKSPSHQSKPTEPNIDFELDIKVLINSGKCVLHTKDFEDKLNFAQNISVKQHKRERSIGTTADWGSPVPTRRNKEKPRIRLNNALLTELTIFRIPGLDVKLHYESKTIIDDVSPRLSTCESLGMSYTKRQSSKRASLFAWMTLQSIPEETIISPHILEFLEQTLEPIPSKLLTTPTNPVNMDLLQKNYATYASFPVDVIVYFHMQPSTFRFSCLPVSRVECMLKLPSLDIVFSSKRQEEVMNDNSEVKTTGGGGLSVTGCLADFNVYIFHPYGGKKLKENQFSPLSDSERKDSLSINVEFVKFHLTRSRKLNFDSNSNKKSDQRAMIRFSTIVDIGSASFKYDMRRLTEILAFPKAWYRHSIVRRLFLGDLNIHQTSTGDLEFTPSDEDKSNYAKGLNDKDFIPINKDNLKYQPTKSNSTDSNVSPVSEPNQITAWETLVLFGVNFTKLNVQMNMGNVMGNVVWLTKGFQSDGRLSIGSTGYKNMYIGIGLGSSALDAKGGIVGGTIELSKINTHFHIREEIGFEPNHTIGIKLLALELRLDYMGTSVLMTRISSLNARLRDEWKNSGEYDHSSGRPTIILIHCDLSWDQLQMLISKSTTADLLKMYFKLEEFFSQQFKSSKRVFSSLESKSRTPSNANNTNSMKRKQLREQLKKKQANIQTEEPGYQSVPTESGHRNWQKPLDEINGLFLSTLGVPLTNKGTILGGTMELHGKNISLACFHGINFKSKSWALFSLKDPCINFATEAQKIGNSDDVKIIQTLTFGLGVSTANPNKKGFFSAKGLNQAPPAYQQHQNHSMATVCRLSRNIIFPPQFKTLHEWFHYAFSNSEIDSVDRFPVLEREKSNEPNTNSIERMRGNTTAGTSSGTNSHPKLQDPNHNREVIFALPSLQLHFKTEHFQQSMSWDSTLNLSDTNKPMVECSFITEFDDHIFVTVDADAFFFLHDLITSYLKEKEKVISNLTASGLGGAYPQRSMSPHLQSSSKAGPSNSGNTTNNSSSHLNVEVDSNDLKPGTPSLSKTPSNASSISIKLVNDKGDKSPREKEIHISNEDIVQAINLKAVNSNKSLSQSRDTVDLDGFSKDFRDFICKTWHLEPTVRLLSWGGKSIEPYGIDYILNKLGFSHARTTIPKWLQRGFMDPLDKLQTLLMLQLLSMVREDRNQSTA